MVEDMQRLMMVVLGLTCVCGAAIAGSIGSTGPPGSQESKMPALGDIYTYLTTGTPVPTPGTSFTKPSAGPGPTGRTLAEVYAAVATPFPQCDAEVTDVRSGKKFFCTAPGGWGVQTGTVTAVGELLKTGQTVVYAIGDDGMYRKGAAFNLIAGGDNTVIDAVTELQWQAGPEAGKKTWADAIAWAEALVQDGKSDWRLPNVTELQTLLVRDVGQVAPFINQTMFPMTVPNYYWSSTTDGSNVLRTLCPSFSHSGVGILSKTASYYVRAVRGGE